MARPTDSPMVAMAVLAAVLVGAIGMHREGVAAAKKATANNSSEFVNTTAGAVTGITAQVLELAPLLVLGMAAVVVLRTVQ